DVGDVAAGDRHRQDLRLEPGAGACRARYVAHVALVPVPRPVRLGVLMPPLDPLHHALEPGVVRALAAVPVPISDVDLILRAIEDCLLRPLGQLAPWRVDVEA